jgi:hypothetical protein
MAASDVPAEALLVRRARMARRMSPEDAAPLAGVIKARRWRQIEQGQRADDEVLAHMSAAVGLDPEQLEQVNRGEAAEVLREIRRQEPVSPPAAGPVPGVDLSVLTPAEQRDLIGAARRITQILAKAEAEQQDDRRGA